MKKDDFQIGIKFRTSTGEWLVTEVDDFKVMAKPLWRWAPIKNDDDIGSDREHYPENFPAIPFNRKHWPACITVEDGKRAISAKRHKYSRIPCYRCYNDDRQPVGCDLAANPTQHLEPVDLGQVDIQKNQIG